MVFDIELIRKVYGSFAARVEQARKVKGTSLTLAEKILYAHLYDASDAKAFRRGVDYVNFRPDRVAMQDATAQMALLQFMNAGRDRSAVPASVHCDHLIQADRGAASDVSTANDSNREVRAGIIHQVVLENYAFPGGMMIGTDSHTPNAGGLGMVAIGVGGADAVDVMAGMPWELKMPKIIGVKLTGRLSGWASPKDVILKLAGILTVKGGTNAILEYFGDGAASLSATGKATICNMGAEVGPPLRCSPMTSRWRATCALPDAKNGRAGRRHSRFAARRRRNGRRAGKYYDRVIEIDLSSLEPYINGPFTPDAAHTISEFGAWVRYTAERDGILQSLLEAGGTVMANACGHAANAAGQSVMLDEPKGDELPASGFDVKDNGYVAPDPHASGEVAIAAGSNRLQRLEPFAAWDGNDFTDLRLLIKASGKCTTDHISMAGPWLRFRGHLENISDNLLMGAVNKFNGQTNSYKAKGIGSIVVAEENYGEGSSREHAALEPRFLNVKVVLVKSFARIHETNLKKQGMLALTFADPADYDRIREDDRIEVTGLKTFAPAADDRYAAPQRRNVRVVRSQSYLQRTANQVVQGGSRIELLTNCSGIFRPDGADRPSGIP
ncbi:unnamed protein product [Mycena citricolor]|uniref:Aconitate hydratase, mitochondrial n=1 Tax=Mycena citricolor TaxID=2018698 RepID=A0AAD2Q4I7_9AGAR|nr:unnamed protein product [Mycena citricolor]